MNEAPYIAEVAALIGDPARANMLCALKNDGVLSATELAHIAGVAPNTASGHLAKLGRARLVKVSRRGRHRYYRMACDEVADALEALEALAANAAPRHRPKGPRDDAVRFARSCYDHLAGVVGVALTGTLVRRGDIRPTREGFALSRKGETAFADLGIDLEGLAGKRRPLMRRCPDWSERRPHLGGALGAGLFARLCALGWLQPAADTRAVTITDSGRWGFRERFQIDVGALHP